ncbi:MAG TPA: hydroxymethylbilane synthase [Chitinophagaceae bacterium]|nr:hydroxymethylbilane synthase [Chitinophagaceae bacterium]
MSVALKIGTRDSQLAVWQATLVKGELAKAGISSELVYIKSDGDIDLVTPLYAMNVQGVFTKALDAALLSNRIDIAVHSMKDVPTQLAQGIVQAAVLKRASYKDIFIYKHKNVIDDWGLLEESPDNPSIAGLIATSSVRRKAQWLHRYPNHGIENLRGNVNTRLHKVEESNWDGAIFAAAGLERIHVRPANSIELPWMLPAPAQGAIMVVCREGDAHAAEACGILNDAETAVCTKLERDFLKTLMGGCSTPISALAEIKDNILTFKGSILSTDGKQKVSVEKNVPAYGSYTAENVGIDCANEVLQKGGANIVQTIRNAANW